MISALFISEAFYGLDLLASINISKVLRFILRAVTDHIRELFLTIFLAICVIYSFSLWVELYLANHLDTKATLCTSLVHCFWSILDIGLRNGEGVGGLTNPASFKSGNYNQ